MPSTLENMKRQVQATIDGYNSRDYDAIRATRSDDFIHQCLPSTLDAPARNNEKDAEDFKTFLTPLFTTVKVSPLTTTHDAEAKLSVIFATVDVESLAGADSAEIVLMLSFDETGEKITRIDEFFDSLTMANVFAKIHVAQAGNAGESK